MAISKKPKKEEVDVEALILKGGTVPKGNNEEAEDKKIPVQLRLTSGIIQEIDRLLGKRVIKIPRHTWFVEAIAEKIKKEREELD